MNFEFSEEQLFIRDQARNFLSQECATSVVRQVLDTDKPFDRDLWQKIVDLGWTAMTIPESYGGLGLGYLELCVIAEELGRSLAPVPFSSSVYLATEALKSWGSEEQKQHYLPRLAAGECIGTLAMNEGLGTPSVAAQVLGGKVTANKLPVPDGDIADFVVLTARDENGKPSLYLAELGGPGVKRETLASMDPSRSQARIAFDDPGEHGSRGDRIVHDYHLRKGRGAVVLTARMEKGGATAHRGQRLRRRRPVAV